MSEIHTFEPKAEVPSREGRATGSTHPWFAIRVKSNLEATVSTHLYARSFEPYLPLYRCRTRWSDRTKEIDRPLFPGYVFCRLDVSNRLPVLSAPGVVGILGCGRIPIAIPDAEIAAVQKLVSSGLPSGPWPFLRVGQKVVIERGALQGTEGYLIKQKNRYRLVVTVSLLQRSVAVEIDAACVRGINSPPVLGMGGCGLSRSA